MNNPLRGDWGIEGALRRYAGGCSGYQDRLRSEIRRIGRPRVNRAGGGRRCGSPAVGNDYWLVAAAASSISSASSSGREISDRCDALTSSMVAPARSAMSRCAAGVIVLSSVPRRYQEGITFQAVAVVGAPAAANEIGRWVTPGQGQCNDDVAMTLSGENTRAHATVAVTEQLRRGRQQEQSPRVPAFRRCRHRLANAGPGTKRSRPGAACLSRLIPYAPRRTAVGVQAVTVQCGNQGFQLGRCLCPRVKLRGRRMVEP
jgi:hypothetical protein